MIFLRIAALLGGLALACGAQAQVAFRAATSVGVSGASAITFAGNGNSAARNTCGSIVPTLPGGNVGDLLIAVVAAHALPTVTMTGWNQLFLNSDASGITAVLFWRIATGGDPTTITQAAPCNSFIGQIARFRGVDTTNPFATAPLAASNDLFQNANNVKSGTQSVAYGGAMVVFTTHTADNDDGMGNVAGMNQQFNSATTTGSDSSVALYTSSPATAPPYTAGPFTASKNRGADPNFGVVFALRPANSRLVLNVPAGTANGDVLIASIATTPSGTTVTAPAGWTSALATTQGTATSNALTTFYRIATGAEPASYTFDLDGTTSAGAAGEMSAFSGVDTLTPINAQGGNATASGLTHTANAITTTVAGTMLVEAFEFASSPTAANWNPNQGTKALAQSSVAGPNNAGVALVMGYQTQAAAGSTGTKSATASGVTADTGAAQIFALRPTLTHYAISVSSSTVATCDTVQVTITGHDPSHNAVAAAAGRSLSITTSTGTGIWQAGTVSGTGAWTPSGTNNGQATYLWPGGETSFTVLLRQNSAVNVNINLNDGSVVEGTGAEDPTIAFVNSSLRISDGLGAAATIGTQISGKPSNTGFGSQALYLQAINSGGTGACGTLLPTNTDVTFEVGAQCNNPASCTQNVTLTSSALSSNTATFVPNGAYPATMKFRFTTANSEAPFVLKYADAGQITLQFRMQLPGSSPAQYLQGTSNALVVRPFGLALPGIHHANTFSGAAGSLFPGVAAGDNFPMTVTAYQWAAGEDANNDGVPDSTANITDNGTTPNFAGTATLSATSNTAGVAGSVSRGATCTNLATIALVAGTATANDWCYSEAGNVLLSATVSNYLGSGQDVTGSSGFDGDTTNGPYVGRFHPKKFVVSNVALTTRSDLACAPASSFTYMDETLRLGLRLTAQNAQGATTQNYTGSYALLGVGTFASWNLGARDAATATDVSSRIDSGVAPTGSWSNGVANMTFTTAIKRTLPPGNLDNPAGPFSTLHFGIAPTDSDGTAMDTLDLDVDGVGGNDHRDLGFVTDVRFGRLRLDNALGSEARRLAVPMSVEYWSGSGFATNTADNCTSIPRSAIALDFTPVSNLTACETAVDSATLTFASGVAPLGLVKPGTGNNGSVALTVNLGTAAGTYCPAVGAGTAAATSVAMPYLLGRWNDAVDADANPNTAYDDKPGARGSFGLYGSQPGTFIYFRERFD